MTPTSAADNMSAPDTTRRESSTPGVRDERPLGEIVNDAWLRAEVLIRQELQLGLADVDERVERVKGEASHWLAELKVELLGRALGVAILFTGMLALVAAVIMLLGTAIKPWLAALIVALALLGAGFLLVRRSIHVPDSPGPRELIPQRSLNSIDQDIKAIKEATK
jgi:hypothetical protein